MIQLIPQHIVMHSLTEQHSNRCSSRAQSKILLGGLNIPVSKQWCVYNTSILSFSVWAPPIQDIPSVCGETVSPLGLREMKQTHTHTHIYTYAQMWKFASRHRHTCTLSHFHPDMHTPHAQRRKGREELHPPSLNYYDCLLFFLL